MMAFPITPEMQQKNDEFSLKWLDLYQEQVNLCHSQQTQQIKLLKKNIYDKYPKLKPKDDNSDVQLIHRERYSNYLKNRLEHGYNYLAQIDIDSLPYNVMSLIHKAKLDMRMVLRAVNDAGFIGNEPTKIPDKVFEQMQQFETSQLKIIPQPPVQPTPDNLIEEVPEPKQPETTSFEFLKDINEGVYNSFKKLYDQFITDIHLIVFNKTIVDSVVNLLETPSDSVPVLRQQLKEAEEKVSCFDQAVHYLRELQYMIREL